MDDEDRRVGDGGGEAVAGREKGGPTRRPVHRGDGPDGTPAERVFGWRGWLLVAGLAVAFVVVPALVYVRPPGVSFTFAYLVLPLVPAVLLALMAVWAATR